MELESYHQGGKKFYIHSLSSVQCDWSPKIKRKVIFFCFNFLIENTLLLNQYIISNDLEMFQNSHSTPVSVSPLEPCLKPFWMSRSVWFFLAKKSCIYLDLCINMQRPRSLLCIEAKFKESCPTNYSEHLYNIQQFTLWPWN